MFLRLLFVSSCVFYSTASFSQMLADPSRTAGGGYKGAAVFSASEVEYESESSSFDFERKVLGGEFASSIGSGADFFAQFGYSFDSEAENISEDGTGFLLGAGARGVVYSEVSTVQILAHGMLNYLSDKIKDNSVTHEMTVTDIHLGTTAVYMGGKFFPYIGLELVPFSDGSFESKIGKYKTKADIERDDLMNLRIGCSLALSTLVARVELVLAGEQTFTLGVGKNF